MAEIGDDTHRHPSQRDAPPVPARACRSRSITWRCESSIEPSASRASASEMLSDMAHLHFPTWKASYSFLLGKSMAPPEQLMKVKLGDLEIAFGRVTA